MATITAHFLIGSVHTYHGAIQPTHVVSLHENSRPALVLRTWDPAEAGEQIVWIPTVETMLEDALLLIAIHAVSADTVVDATGPTLKQPRVELHRDISPSDLKALHARNREYAGRKKVVMTILNESSIREQIPVLKHYRMEMELCVPVFHRWFHPSKQEFVTKGLLDIIPEVNQGN